MNHQQLIDEYAAGPALLRAAVAGMTREQLRARPIAGKWSAHEVVCHFGDFEPIYLDRIRRVIAEENPRLMGGDESLFAKTLRYDERDTEEELQLVAACRASLVRTLRALSPADFARRGTHSEAGELTLEQILRSAANHIPHHVKFIQEKRQALGA